MDKSWKVIKPNKSKIKVFKNQEDKEKLLIKIKYKI